MGVVLVHRDDTRQLLSSELAAEQLLLKQHKNKNEDNDNKDNDINPDDTRQLLSSELTLTLRFTLTNKRERMANISSTILSNKGNKGNKTKNMKTSMIKTTTTQQKQ